MYVYSSFSHNCYKLKISQVSINLYMEKNCVVHFYNGIVLSNKKWKRLRQRPYDTVWFHLYNLLEKAKLQGLGREHINGWEWEKELISKGHEGICENDGNTLYFDCGGGYVIMYIWQEILQPHSSNLEMTVTPATAWLQSHERFELEPLI